jgi:ABC-type Mn2+/Zn2+ transport system permease subunit
VSAVPQQQQQRVDMVAGFLCAFSFALSGIAIARSPGVLAPAAILVALVAARMTESHRTLAGVAVAVSALSFFLGMLVAISTDTPLY